MHLQKHDCKDAFETRSVEIVLLDKSKCCVTNQIKRGNRKNAYPLSFVCMCLKSGANLDIFQLYD